MADENKTVEIIELKLEYESLLSSLKTVVKQYDENIKKIKESTIKPDFNISDVTKQINTQFGDISSVANKHLATMTIQVKDMLVNLRKVGGEGSSDLLKLIQGFGRLDKIIVDDVDRMNTLVNMLKKLGASDAETNKLISSFKKISKSIDETRDKYYDAAKSMEKLELTGPLKKAEMALTPIKNKMDSVFRGIEASSRNMFNAIDKGGFSPTNAGKAIEYWNIIEKTERDGKNTIAKVEKEITTLYNQEFKLRSDAALEYNEVVANSLRSYASRMAKFRSELQKQANDDKLVLQELSNTSRKFFKDYATDFQSMAKTKMGSTGEWGNTAAIMDQMREKVRQVQKATQDLSKEGGDKARLLAKDFDVLRETFNRNRQEINETIKVLEKMGRSGLINTDKTIADLKKLQQQYSTLASKVASENNTIVRDLATQERKIEQSFFGRFWDGFNKLRWQVIAASYLFGMLASAIERTFVGNLQKVDDFRRSVFALTASIGMTLGKSFESNFELVWNQSRDLLEKLQAKAATTYASLEDMTMILRSFALSGIFPKTDEDIDKIATLSTAIKVMTEGMANAGVQMRQEIMALIEGRQRVTDSLALALRMQGIDIKKEMDKWAREGTDKLTGFAKLFESFNVINKKITNEYGVQVNYLKEMWSYIKRIGLEDFTLKVAKDINSFVESLGVPGKELTDRGQSISNLFKSTFSTFYEVLSAVGKTILVIIDSMVKWGSILTGIDVDMKKVDNSSDTLAATINRIAQGITLIGGGIEIVLAAFRDMIKQGGSLTELIGTSVKWIGKMFIEGVIEGLNIFKNAFKGGIFNKDLLGEYGYDQSLKLADELFKGIKPSTDEVKSGVEGINKSSNELEQTIQKISQRFDDLQKKIKAIGNTPEQQKFITDLETVKGQIGEIAKAASKAETDRLKYIPKTEKYDEEIKSIVEEQKAIDILIQKIKEKNLLQLATTSAGRSYTGGGEKIMDRTAKTEFENTLRELEEWSSLYYKKTNETIDALRQKQIEKEEKQLSDYMGFIEKVMDIDPWSKLAAQADKYYQEIEKGIADKNPAFVKHGEYLKHLVDVWYNSQTVDLMNEINDAVGDFSRKITQPNASNLDKIREQYANINKEIEKNEKLKASPATKQYLLEQSKLNESLKLQKQAIDDVTTAQLKYLDSFEPQLKLMEMSVSFSDRQAAALARLTLEFQKSSLSQAKEFDDLRQKFEGNAEALKLITDAQNNYAINSLKLYTEQSKEILDPFYKDLKEMNKQWADEISSTLTDIIFDFKDWEKSITNLLNSMAKQVINAFIKDKLVQPMMDAMNNVGKDQSSGMGLNTVGIAGGQFNPLMYLGKFSDMLFGKTGKQTTSSTQTDLLSKMFSGSDSLTGMRVFVTNMESLTGGITGGLEKAQSDALKTATSSFTGSTGTTSTSGLSDYYSKFLSQDIMNKVLEESTKKSLDANWIAAMLMQESGGSSSAVSNKGASGLMQLLPSTFKSLGYNSSDIFNPYKNIEAGTDYFKQQLDKFGSYDLATAAYNAGPGAVDKYGGIPPYTETQNYLSKVSSNFTKATGDFQVATDSFQTSTNSFDLSTNSFSDVTSKFGNLSDTSKLDLTKSSSLLGGGSSMTSPIPVYVTNLTGGGLGGGTGTDATKSIADKLSSDNKSMLSGLWSSITGIFSGIFNNISSMFSGMIGLITNIFSSLSSSISSLLSSIMNSSSSSGGGSSGGGFGGLLGSLFSNWGGSSGGGGGTTGYDEGGWVTEPIIGKGLRSGQSYSFGEKESEWIVPQSKLQSINENASVSRQKTIVHMPIQVNAIDTQSGVDFIMKNSKVYEALMSKAFKNNRNIRRDVRNAY